MIELFESVFLSPTKAFRRLSVLMAIRQFPDISQHKMARMTRLSSSMVNNYVKALKQEQMISITGETNRTCRYHLTQKGREELLSLILSYSAEIIRLYGEAKAEIVRRLRQIRDEGIESVALFGASSTAEVVSLGIQEVGLKVLGVVDSDPGKQGRKFGGVIIQPPEALKHMNMDAVVATSFGRQEEIHNVILKFVDPAVRVVKLSNL